MKKFDYDIEKIRDDILQRTLDERGKEGWELCGVSSVYHPHVCNELGSGSGSSSYTAFTLIFKRESQD